MTDKETQASAGVASVLNAELGIICDELEMMKCRNLLQPIC